MPIDVLLMPGINNSGPTHWQSLWKAANPSFRTVEVADWDHPVRADWIDAIDRTVCAAGTDVIIVAHSLGCLPVVERAMRAGKDTVRGLMLVSVPDPLGPNFPAAASGFTPPPLQRLPSRSVVVSSEDDPYGAPDYARRCAEAWGSRFINAGMLGHINASSGLGEWTQGWEILQSLRE